MKLKVLNGYINLKGIMGDELSVVNGARQSFDAQETVFTEEHATFLNGLIQYRELHPFRHVVFQFEMKAPFVVMRQLQRYVIGTAQADTMGAWSEMSLRYVSKIEKDRFYIPKAASWRMSSKSAKDGASNEELHFEKGTELSNDLTILIDSALRYYDKALEMGVAPEMARLFLSVNTLYVTWTMTLSLQSLLHILDERLGAHAMQETREYAEAMEALLERNLPVLHTAWKKGKILW